MAAVTTDVQRACDDPDIPDDDEIHSWVEAAVTLSGQKPAGDVEVSVRIVGADEMRALNGRYRGRDYATNVLSFPAGGIDGLPPGVAPLMGDIVICAPVVTSEAGEQGKSSAAHWAHMIVHGVLHLLGFDHEEEADADRMEAAEARILASKNVTDPYAGGL